MTNTRAFSTLILLLLAALAACAAPPAQAPTPVPEDHGALPVAGAALPERAIPPLPFPDNPDPTLCGIPVRWGLDDPAWLSGLYEGALIQPEVLLYDSHLRRSVLASAPHGAEVRILLYQANPVLDYYLVRVVDGVLPDGAAREGWVPGPFLAFAPVADG